MSEQGFSLNRICKFVFENTSQKKVLRNQTSRIQKLQRKKG